MSATGQLDTREVAALAAGLLLIDDARLYGLIDSGPDINRARCGEVLEQAKAQGIVPTKDEVDAAVAALCAGPSAALGEP